MKYYLLWLLYFIPALLVEWVSWVLSPITALFVFTEPRTDRVKRLDNQTLTMDRDYLIKPFFYLFQTHDNAVDEYWYGCFNKKSRFETVRNWTQKDYDSSAIIRYFCRVAWLMRNSGYGWTYLLFSIPVGEGFQLKGIHPIWGSYYNDYNIGWKAHKGFPLQLYANRIIGIRKKEEQHDAI